MRYTLFAILSLAAPHGTFALTWDFDEGTTWGWTARESPTYSSKAGSGEPLHSEIVDGVWRIAPVPGRRPTVQLRSPLIGKRLGSVRPHHPTAAPHPPQPDRGATVDELVQCREETPF